jgi:hypothetical protein
MNDLILRAIAILAESQGHEDFVKRLEKRFDKIDLLTFKRATIQDCLNNITIGDLLELAANMEETQ